MNKNFAIIGGDLRIIKLAQMLAKDGNNIYTYGLEKSKELKSKDNIVMCNKLEEAIEKSDIIIGPIPFSSDGENINAPFGDKKILINEIIHNNKMLIAGSIKPEICNLFENEGTEIIDIMKREELAILNAISTVEGTIEIVISNTSKIIQGSKILILGFGRIGKILAHKFTGISANVTCAARKSEDLAWIKAYGYRGTNINEIGKNLSEYDIIINTVPHLILTEEKIKYLKDECLLVDLASKPGGIDENAANKRKIKFIWALALPGKVAPVTTAEFIKDTIYDIMKRSRE